jgi:hypothetical protein
MLLLLLLLVCLLVRPLLLVQVRCLGMWRMRSRRAGPPRQ